MVIELTMPRLSDTMEQGTIIRWNVREGDRISAGDAVADVETDKATMEMQVYDDGQVARILVGEGQTVDVGTVIAVLAEKGEDADAVAAGAAARLASDTRDRAAGPGAPAPPGSPRPPAPAGAPRIEPAARPAPAAGAPPPAPAAAPPVTAEPPGQGDGRIRVSPVARRLADEHGVDLRTLEGSGPAGRIIKRDVERAVEASRETAAAIPPAARPPAARERLAPVRVSPAPPPRGGEHGLAAPAAPLEDRIVPLSAMRQTIARRLVESATTIPHYQVSAAFDMDALLDLRATLNEQLAPGGVKLSINDFLVRGCALAMHRHPEFNASFEGDHVAIHGRVNIGLAIAIPAERGGGLVVGTIRDADRKSLRAISEESKRLAEKARTRGLTIEEMADSTFALSNLGMYGVDHFTAIINPPNTAILAVGAAQQRPVVRDGKLAVGHEMTVTLSLDHRVIDGAMAAEYLRTLRALVESPATLLV